MYEVSTLRLINHAYIISEINDDSEDSILGSIGSQWCNILVRLGAYDN